MKKKEWMFVAIVLLIAGLVYSGNYIISVMNSGQEMVKVMVNGETYGTYDLAKNQTVTIECQNQSYNILKIEDGKAMVIEASCPDKLCVHQSAIDRNSESIICLPNKVVVEIESSKESEFDTLAQ